MHIIARVPVSGYTPGQTIHIEINVDNKSIEEGEFSIELVKQIKYVSNGGYTRLETILICEKQNIGLSQVNTFYTYHGSLVIPPLPPTDETSSSVCKVRYLLRVLGAVSCCHNDVMLEFPITIGSYPILDNMHITSYPTVRNANEQLTIDGSESIELQDANTSNAHHPLLRQDVFDGVPRYPLASSHYRSTNDSTTGAAESITTNQPPSYSIALPFPDNGEITVLNNYIYYIAFYNFSLHTDPPTYEEAIENNEAGGKRFHPKYPVYRRQTS